MNEGAKYSLHYQVPVVDAYSIGHHHLRLYYQIFWATTDRFQLAPLLLQVSIQLYTPREKQQLADLVDTMISYNLSQGILA